MIGSFPDLRRSQSTGKQRRQGLDALMEPLEAVVGTQETLGKGCTKEVPAEKSLDRGQGGWRMEEGQK